MRSLIFRIKAGLNKIFKTANSQDDYRAESSAADTSRQQPCQYADIVAARAVKIEKHPNADRLRIVALDIGGKIVEPVVCGAFNFEVGDLVALALPGAKIAQNIHSETHESFILEKAKIRGVESQGMICAGYELGLTESAEKGIMLLKNDVKPGSQFSPEMVK